MRTTHPVLVGALLAGLVLAGCRSDGGGVRYQPVVKAKTVSQKLNPNFNPHSPRETGPEFITVESYEYGAFDTKTGVVKGPN